MIIIGCNFGPTSVPTVILIVAMNIPGPELSDLSCDVTNFAAYFRQHLSSVMRASGAQLRTQLCLSAGVSVTEVTKFETAHKTLKEEEMNILFCDHLNSLRTDRGSF